MVPEEVNDDSQELNDFQCNSLFLGEIDGFLKKSMTTMKNGFIQKLMNTVKNSMISI